MWKAWSWGFVCVYSDGTGRHLHSIPVCRGWTAAPSLLHPSARMDQGAIFAPSQCPGGTGRHLRSIPVPGWNRAPSLLHPSAAGGAERLSTNHWFLGTADKSYQRAFSTFVRFKSSLYRLQILTPWVTGRTWCTRLSWPSRRSGTTVRRWAALRGTASTWECAVSSG